MFNGFLMLIGLFLIVLGLISVYLGVSTYVHLTKMRLVGQVHIPDLVEEERRMPLRGLTDADKPIYFPSKPIYNLACMTGIGLLPLLFGSLLFARIFGIF